MNTIDHKFASKIALVEIIKRIEVIVSSQLQVIALEKDAWEALSSSIYALCCVFVEIHDFDMDYDEDRKKAAMELFENVMFDRMKNGGLVEVGKIPFFNMPGPTCKGER